MRNKTISRKLLECALDPMCTLAVPVVVLLLLVAMASSQTSDSWVRGPLVVDRSSNVVVMEYENWFGPNAVTFQGAAAAPLLQSADMQAVGGGYDSADPNVIRTHLARFEYRRRR